MLAIAIFYDTTSLKTRPSITLYAVEAIEVNPPPGQEAIHCRLLTTHRVVCVEQALQECLSVIETSLQGRTKNLQNPYPPASLPWATWLIARLGGWSGYSSQRPPGMPTLVQGLRQFESIFLGWKLAQNQLVCTR